MVTNCPLCGADGYEGIEDFFKCECHKTLAWTQYVLKREKLTRLKTKLENSLSERYREYITTPLSASFKAANKELYTTMMAAAPGDFYYLYGDAGTGKSHLALITASRLLVQHGLSVGFVGEAGYFKALTDSFSYGAAPADPTQVDVLVYDDFGRRRGTPFVVDELSRIMEDRWADRKTTIITSNFDPDEAVANLTDSVPLGSGILSRMTCGYTFRTAGDTDRRQGTGKH
jgi:DNA replication protein DnaC